MIDGLPPPLAPAQPMPGPMLPPPGMNGIPGATGMPVPPAPAAPPPPDLGITPAQADGTHLIYIKNPDGSMGPVIHIFKPTHAKEGSGKK